MLHLTVAGDDEAEGPSCVPLISSAVTGNRVSFQRDDTVSNVCHSTCIRDASIRRSFSTLVFGRNRVVTCVDIQGSREKGGNYSLGNFTEFPFGTTTRLSPGSPLSRLSNLFVTRCLTVRKVGETRVTQWCRRRTVDDRRNTGCLYVSLLRLFPSSSTTT